MAKTSAIGLQAKAGRYGGTIGTTEPDRDSADASSGGRPNHETAGR